VPFGGWVSQPAENDAGGLVCRIRIWRGNALSDVGEGGTIQEGGTKNAETSYWSSLSDKTREGSHGGGGPRPSFFTGMPEGVEGGACWNIARPDPQSRPEQPTVFGLLRTRAGAEVGGLGKKENCGGFPMPLGDRVKEGGGEKGKKSIEQTGAREGGTL